VRNLAGAADDELDVDHDVLRRRVVPIEAAEEDFGGSATHRGRILGDNRHGGFEQVRKLDVVEADQRRRVLEAQVAKRMERADRDQVLRGEDGGRRVRCLEQLVRRTCSRIDASEARADDRRIFLDPERGETEAVAAEPV